MTTTFTVYGSTFHVDRKYQNLGPLGRGSYGVVCAARDRETNSKVAIKKISPMAAHTVDAKRTLREVRLMRYLGRHKNVISLKDLALSEENDEIYLIMELMDTDLHRIIQSKQDLTDAHHKYFLHQLLRGVKFLHDNHVLHRDIKPGNLLVTKNCDLRITDFGLARVNPAAIDEELPGNMTEHVVTRWYRPPELMLSSDGNYTAAVDIWSCGCILAELLGRTPLFPGKNFVHQLTLIFDVIGTPPRAETAHIKSGQAQRFLRSLSTKGKVPFSQLFPRASPDAISLLEGMLIFDPAKRFTADQCLAHPYLADLERRRAGANVPPLGPEFNFDFESAGVTKYDIRRMIREEVQSLRREVRGARRGGSAAAASSSRPSSAPRQRRGSAGASSGRASTARGSARSTSAPRRAAQQNQQQQQRRYRPSVKPAVPRQPAKDQPAKLPEPAPEPMPEPPARAATPRERAQAAVAAARSTPRGAVDAVMAAAAGAAAPEPPATPESKRATPRRQLAASGGRHFPGDRMQAKAASKDPEDPEDTDEDDEEDDDDGMPPPYGSAALLAAHRTHVPSPKRASATGAVVAAAKAAEAEAEAEAAMAAAVAAAARAAEVQVQAEAEQDDAPTAAAEAKPWHHADTSSDESEGPPPKPKAQVEPQPSPQKARERVVAARYPSSFNSSGNQDDTRDAARPPVRQRPASAARQRPTTTAAAAAATAASRRPASASRQRPPAAMPSASLLRAAAAPVPRHQPVVGRAAAMPASAQRVDAAAQERVDVLRYGVGIRPGRRSRVTVPKSPQFSKMSWERKQQRAKEAKEREERRRGGRRGWR